MRKFFLGAALMISLQCHAMTTIAIKSTSDQHDMGGISFSATPFGVLITPQVHQLTPGIHGFHLHENPSCDNGGLAAGGHFDPTKTGKHLGPYNGRGHLGDFPALYVDEDGNATLPVLAPRLVIDNLRGHAIIIHSGGDNYADIPAKLGGGGARVGCGVIQ